LAAPFQIAANRDFSCILMFFRQLIDDLTTGSVYALIALGYTMIYGILGLINFAQGKSKSGRACSSTR